VSKKWLVIVVAICALSLLIAGCGQNSQQEEDLSWQNIKDKGEFVIGLDDNFPPMGFRDEKGEIVGFDIDLANEAAKRMGVKVTFKPVEWDGVILSLKSKDIDAIWNGLTITENRKKEIAFTDVYLEDRQIIVVQKDSTINTKKDLDGKVVGLQLGSSSEEALNNDAETAESLKEVRKYGSNAEALMDLETGRIEAVVVDEVAGRYFIAQRPDKYRVLEGEEHFGKESFGVGVRMEDKAFLDELNKAINSMKEDGAAGEICTKWFGEDIITK
jgi:polar amino acid transport system substrate-binding protein